MQPIIRYCLIILFSISCGESVARDFGGINLKEVIRLSPELNPIRLNGATIKRKASHDIYVGGLYLENKTHNLEDILTDEGPKRVLFYCKASSISPEIMIRNIDQGMVINNPPEIISSLEKEIKIFHQIWKDHPINHGDELWIDYIPTTGTRVSVNGQVISQIPGKTFYQAFLRAWLGEYPVNPKLKKAMLSLNG